MKKRFIKVISFCLAMPFVFGQVISAGAAVAPGGDTEIQASNYFTSGTIEIVAAGNGKIDIEVNVCGKTKMTQIGALDVYVYEVQSDGRYTQKMLYTSDRYPELLQSNVQRAVIHLTYQGTAGNKYHVEAKCYAKNDSGSGTRWASSGIVTAT